MSRFVLDASIVLTWCFPDENAAIAQHVAGMFKRGDTAVAPSSWPHEVLNALLAGEKRKRISKKLIRSFLDDLATLPVRLEQGQNRNELTIVTALFDSNGKYLTAVNNVVGVNWTDKPNHDELSHGALPSSNFAVRPGDYLVRVVVCEALSSHMSAETVPVRIP